MRLSNRWLPLPPALLAALLSMAFAPVPKPSPAKEELKRLEGRWEEVRASHDRGRWLKGGAAGAHDEYKGDRLSCVCKGQVTARWRVALDPSREPKAMDLTDGKGEVLLCAYKLDGDELTVAHPTEPGVKGRPEKLTPHKGAHVAVFKRVKKRP